MWMRRLISIPEVFRHCVYGLAQPLRRGRAFRLQQYVDTVKWTGGLVGASITQPKERMMSKMHALRISFLMLAGLVASLVYILAVGLLTVSAIGARDGAAFSLNNSVVAITEPHVPYLQMISIMLLGLLVAYALLVGTGKQPPRDRLALSGGFSVGTAALVLYSFAGLGISNARASVVEAELAGWKGWIYKAGSDSSVHLLLALILAWMLFQILQASKASQVTEAKSIH